MKSNIEYWEDKKNEYGAEDISESKIGFESTESLDDLLEKEERRVESLNQDEASETFHLFTV